MKLYDTRRDTMFLVASKRLYKSACPYVGRAVGLSVCMYVMFLLFCLLTATCLFDFRTCDLSKKRRFGRSGSTDSLRFLYPVSKDSDKGVSEEKSFLSVFVSFCHCESVSVRI